MFHQALGFFDDHFGHLDMALGRLVKGGADHLPLDRTLHVGHFLRPLIDKQHEQDNVLVIFGNAVGKHCKQHGFARARRRDDQPALAEAHGGQQIHDAGGIIFGIGFQVDF